MQWEMHPTVRAKHGQEAQWWLPDANISSIVIKEQSFDKIMGHLRNMPEKEITRKLAELNVTRSKFLFQVISLPSPLTHASCTFVKLLWEIVKCVELIFQLLAFKNSPRSHLQDQLDQVSVSISLLKDSFLVSGANEWPSKCTKHHHQAYLPEIPTPSDSQPEAARQSLREHCWRERC